MSDILFLSSITMNCQGWTFKGLGVHLPASSILSMSFPSTFLAENSSVLFLALMSGSKSLFDATKPPANQHLRQHFKPASSHFPKGVCAGEETKLCRSTTTDFASRRNRDGESKARRRRGEGATRSVATVFDRRSKPSRLFDSEGESPTRRAAAALPRF